MTGDPETTDTETLDITAEEIEAAYARALGTMDAVEHAVPELATANDDPELTSQPVPGAVGNPQASDPGGDPPTQLGTPDHQYHAPIDVPVLAPHAEQVIQPHQVVEAALFVGGGPLTAKRLAKLLGDDSSGESAVQIITRLNEQYVDEARPYEISLQEGGYSLTLRSEFQRVRDRVYGRNPKEVKLSQEALEVLAFVAYRQPARCQDVEDAGKTNAASVLRQLLRRQLVSLQRDDGADGDVTYVTTPRFLELFGLRHLDELPLPDDLALK